MADCGVYAISRDLWDDADFPNEPYTERQAWAWMIGATAWRDHRIHIDGNALELQRGEFCHSVRFLARKWIWSKSRVARFLNKLKKRDTIQDVSRDGCCVYFIKNYDRFQVVGLPERDTETTPPVGHERDTSGTGAGQQRDKEETFKHSNIENRNISVKPPKAKKALNGHHLEFEAFYRAYPKRVARGAALKAYASALARGAFPEVVLAGAQRYAIARAREDPKFTKAPATWLNAECWLDEAADSAPKLDPFVARMQELDREH